MNKIILELLGIAGMCREWTLADVQRNPEAVRDYFRQVAEMLEYIARTIDEHLKKEGV